MTRALIIVDGRGEVVGDAGTLLGACRQIAAASDDDLTWQDVATQVGPVGGSITLRVAGGPETYAVLPNSEIETP
jgi:hypothetical protein